jgi:bifunctional non-homologous end joining protein LigD
MSAPFSPMLATLGSTADVLDENDWAFEMKWDGIRAIARIKDGAVTLTSRNGKDMTSGYPELAELASVVHAQDATLDGEIVSLNRQGRPDFGLLQGRTNLANAAEISRAAAAAPVTYMVFDIVALDSVSLVNERYDERRKTLLATVRPGKGGRIQVPPAFGGNLNDAIATSKSLELEGVVAKKLDGRYAVGTRSRSWIKIKHHRAQEVVVGGWRPGQGRREASIGSLLLGIPDGDTFRYVGRVGTGFSDAMLDEIRHELDAHSRAKPSLTDVPRADASDAHWVEPVLVGEVAFAEWTAAGRLRQPTWRGWRTDKDAKDVRRE